MRRSGARNFLEIRPNKTLSAGETFDATIVGKTTLELPATILPPIFAGTDAISFNGILRIVAAQELRLYAKQIRGLLTIGEIGNNEMTFGIVSSPMLRLDVARVSELLAPVALENFSLTGTIENPDHSHFLLTATATVREAGAEISVLSGEAALRNFPETNAFSVRAAVDEKTKKTTYFLTFPSRGDFEIRLEFDAKIRKSEGWKFLDFTVPAVQVAPFTISGLGEKIDFAPSKVSMPKRIEKRFTGFLPASGEFDLKWREVSGKTSEFSASVFAAEAISTLKIETGTLRLRENFSLQISQGTLDKIRFLLLGDGNVLNVVGQDILSWSIQETPEKTRFLEIILSQKKNGKYSVSIDSETFFSEEPTEISPIRLVPEEKQPNDSVCVRFNEFLEIESDAAIRVELLSQSGLSQINESVFPSKNRSRQSSENPAQNVVPAENSAGENAAKTASTNAFDAAAENSPSQFFYKISNVRDALKFRINSVRPEISISQNVRCYFDAEKITNAVEISANVRSAPLYETEIVVPADWEISGINGEKIANHEISKCKDCDDDVLKIVFSEAILGETKFEIVLTNAKKIVPEENSPKENFLKISGIAFPKARFVRGYIGLIGAPGVQMNFAEGDGIVEIPAEFFPDEETEIRRVFRIRKAAWSAKMKIEKTRSKLHGNVLTSYKIAEEKTLGNALVHWNSDDERISKIEFSLPKNATLTGFEGSDFSGTISNSNGKISAKLKTPLQGNFSAKISFEILGAPENLDFSGVKLENVSAEEGKIFIKSDSPISLSEPENSNDSEGLCLQLFGDGEWKNDAENFDGDVLAAAFQYVGRDFDLTLSAKILAASEQKFCLVKKAVGALSGSGKSLALDCNFEFASDGKKSISVILPESWILSGKDAVLINERNVDVPEGEREFVAQILGNAVMKISLVPAKKFGKSVPVALPQFDVPVLISELSGQGNFSGTSVKSGMKLNENFKNFFENLRENSAQKPLENRVLLPALAVFVLCIFGISFPRCRENFRKILKVVAALSGAIFAISGVKILLKAALPSFDFSTKIFLGNAVEETIFEPWASMFSQIFPARISNFLFFAILVAGTLFVLFGIFSSTKKMPKIFGRILILFALIFGVPELKSSIPALVSAILLLEIFFFATEFFAICGGKFFEKILKKFTKISGTAALIFVLIYAGTPDSNAESGEFDFENLEVQSEEFSKPQNIAERIFQKIEILSDRVVAEGEIRVKGKIGERFDLLSAPAVLTKFKKNAENSGLRLERRAGKNGFVYQIVLEQAGTFSAIFGYEQALLGNDREISLLSGNASADVVTVKIHRDDSQIRADGAVTISTPAAKTAEIVFKPQENRKIILIPRERDRIGEKLVLFGETTSLYVPNSGMLEGFHSVVLKPSRGVFSIAEIEIPEPFSVSRVEGDSISRWKFGARGNAKILTILFDSPRSTSTEISVYTQAADSGNAQNFAAIHVRNCAENMKTLGIAMSDELQIREISSAGTALPLNEFPKKLIERAAENGVPVTLRRAFRGLGNELKCSSEISAVKPNLRIQTSDTVFLDYDKISLRMDVEANASRANIFSLSFKIPEGFEIENIAGEALAYWNEIQGDNSERIAVMRLKKPLLGSEKFQIRAAGIFKENEKIWEIPRIIFAAAQQQIGEIFVVSANGIRLSLRAREGVIETDDAGVSEEFSLRQREQKADFAFKYFGQNWNAVFEIGTAFPLISAEWKQSATLEERFVKIDANVVFSIENSPVREVKIRLPEDAISPIFSGDEIAGSEKNSGEDLNEWTISFSKPLRGKVEILAKYFLPHKTGTKFPALSFPSEISEKGSFEVLGNWAETAAATAFPSPEISSGVEILRTSLVGQNEVFTEEIILFFAPKTAFLKVVPENSEMLKILINGVPAQIFDASEGEKFVILPRENSDSTFVRILYRSEISPENPNVVTVKTNVHPDFATWSFVPEIENFEFSVEEIFGLSASRVKISNIDSGAKFLPNNAKISFETTRYPFVDAGAVLKISGTPTENSSKAKIFLTIFFLGIALRFAAKIAFQRRKSRINSVQI